MIYTGKQETIVLKTSNNKLYISNSRVNLDASIGFRIDSNNELYIGRGCNFTAEHTSAPAKVTITDEVYVKE